MKDEDTMRTIATAASRCGNKPIPVEAVCCGILWCSEVPYGDWPANRGWTRYAKCGLCDRSLR